jgi:phosphonate transport system substrate-binding protein
MYQKICFPILIFALLLGACSGSAPATEETAAGAPAAPTDAPAGVLVFADISDEPAKVIERTQPIADYLAARLGDFGIGAAEVRVAPDLDTMVQWMADGEVDVYFDSLYPALIVSEAGGKPVLRRWRDGVGEYSTVFFTLADSPINTLDDLQGQVVAMEVPYSTSGFFVPNAFLIESGYTTREKPSPGASAAPDEIGYVFSGEDTNTLQWVVSGHVVAGVTDNIHYEKIIEESNVALKIIAQTEPVARQVAVLRSALDADLQAAIIELLLGLDETDEGKYVLEQHRTDRFDEFPEGPEAAFARMRELLALLEGR